MPASPDQQAGRHGQGDDHHQIGHRRFAQLVGARQPVARTAHGPDESRVGRVGLDLLPQPTDVHRDRRGVTEVPTPHPAQQLLLAERLAGVGGEEGQQVELPRGQAQRLAVQLSLARRRVDDQRPDGDGRAQQRRIAEPLGAAEQRLDPQYQLARREGLDHVVVGAGLQPDQPVLLLAAGRQHHDRRVVAESAAAAQQLQTGQARQHDVQDHHVGAEPLPHLGGLGSVGAPLHPVAGPAEVGEQHLRHRRVVLDDQHRRSHDRASLGSQGRSRRGLAGAAHRFVSDR